MKTYLERFGEMVEALRNHPKVVVLNFATFPPVSDTRFEEISKAIGVEPDPAIESFYRQTNGLQLRWISKENEDFDPVSHLPGAGALDWSFGQRPYTPEDGMVMLLPIETIFLKDLQNVVWFEDMKGKKQAFGHTYQDQLELFKSIRPFDQFASGQDMAFLMKNEQPFTVVWGDDNHACYTNSRLTDFASYLEFIIAHKGLVDSRRHIYFCKEGHEKPYLATLQTYWTSGNSIDLNAYLLNKVFPMAGQAGADTSGLNQALMAQLSKSSEPLTAASLESVCRAHQMFLMSGGGGGHWETLSVSGMVLGFYKGAAGKKGEQASFERKHLPEGLSFEDLVLPFASFCACFAPGVSFARAELTCSLFTDSILDNAIFRGSKLGGSDFSRASLQNADFRDADLRSCDFENCDLRGADFTEAKLEGSRFPGSRLDGVRY